MRKIPNEIKRIGIKYQVEMLINDKVKTVEFEYGYAYELDKNGSRVLAHRINYEELKGVESVFTSGTKYACIRT